MQIKDIALLELFLETICEASDGQSQDDKPSRWQQTITRLETTRISSLAQKLSNRDSLMDHLADRYEANGEYKLAHATRRLANALKDDDLTSSDEQEVHQRLLDYVYPVV